MNPYLDAATKAARSAGELLRSHFGTTLEVNAFEAHDIKLDLDVRSQELITGMLLEQFPDHAIYGEEGLAGNQASHFHWIVDPIDGTVNFFYGIPHFCISIALRQRGEIVVGVIYDPDARRTLAGGERRGGPLNGQPIAVSAARRSSPTPCSPSAFPRRRRRSPPACRCSRNTCYRARKCRLMGSAALDLAYVACGRLDAYIEQSVSLWDMAAGKILVEAPAESSR